MSKQKISQPHKFFIFYGWLGVLMIVFAYAAINFNLLTVENKLYHLLNIFGSIGVGLDAYLRRNFAPVALQIIWIVIALIALISLMI